MKYANFKRMTAMMMAAAMMSTPVVSMAADVTEQSSASGGVTAEGELKDYVNKEAFRVVLPTQTGTQEFILDPQGLLNIADDDTFSIGKGAVYFENTGDIYSNTSDPFVILNKSSYAVDVSFAVDVTLPTGVSFAAEESDLDTATTPMVYLTMKEAGGTDVVLTSGPNAYPVQQAAAVPEASGSDKGYEIKNTGSSIDDYAFTYGLSEGFADSDVKPEGKKSFTLTGACDQTADWSAVKGLESGNKVTASITWKVEKHEEAPAESAPSIATTQYTLTPGQPLEVEVNFGTGSLAADAVSQIVNKKTGNTVPTARYTVVGNKITFDATYTTNNAAVAAEGYQLEVVFSDTSTTKVVINVGQ